MNLYGALDKINETHDAAGLWNFVADYMGAQSVPAYVYHHLPAPGAIDYYDQFFVKKSIGEAPSQLCDLVHDYFTSKFRDSARSMEKVQHWKNCCTVDRLSDQGEVISTQSVSGVTLPVHGPGGRNGCFSIVLPSHQTECENFDLRKVKWLCQSAHQTYCKILIENNMDMPKLTPREIEILSWMALGKTNNEIAICLDISTHTVSTYTRRIFLKTNTADRTSASLYGISNGLLKL